LAGDALRGDIDFILGLGIAGNVRSGSEPFCKLDRLIHLEGDTHRWYHSAQVGEPKAERLLSKHFHEVLSDADHLAANCPR